MRIEITEGVPDDLDAADRLYSDINEHLFQTVNYPGWIKNVYPTRQDAERALHDNELFVARADGVVAGAVILNRKPAEAYYTAPWRVDCDWEDALIVHTLAVHPDYMRRGVGSAVLRFAESFARGRGMRAVRLDSFRTNDPAFRLYEGLGYKYIATVDLGMRSYGLDWFRLYELPLE